MACCWPATGIFIFALSVQSSPVLSSPVLSCPWEEEMEGTWIGRRRRGGEKRQSRRTRSSFFALFCSMHFQSEAMGRCGRTQIDRRDAAPERAPCPLLSQSSLLSLLTLTSHCLLSLSPSLLSLSSLTLLSLSPRHWIETTENVLPRRTWRN